MKLPQLSLREVFLLMVIAAMGCGWWVERRSLAESLAKANASSREWKQTANYFADFLESVGYRVDLEGNASPTYVGRDEP